MLSIDLENFLPSPVEADTSVATLDAPKSISDIETNRLVIQDPGTLVWEETPVGFKTFCEHKDHMDLLPADFVDDGSGDGALSKRQLEDCITVVGDDPLNMFNPEVRKYTFSGLLWAKGCIDGKTLLFDETSQKEYSVKYILDNKLKISIKVRNFKTNRTMIKPVARVFSKGIAKRLEFKFTSGKSIIVSPDHRFYFDNDWIKAKYLSEQNYVAYRTDTTCALLKDTITKITPLEDGEIFDLTIDEETPNYFTADGLLHHNSGKDFVCSIIHAYVVYVLLCLKDPQSFFQFPKGEPCDILAVGKKGDQAKRVYFSKFHARILKWKWMLNKYNVVYEGKRYHYNSPNHPYCKVGTGSAEWTDKVVRAYSENSGNPQSLEGYNIIFFICDEISGWMSESERAKADEILSILRTSQGSRNTKSLTGLGMVISYPRQDDDIMFKLEKESKKPGSNMFFSRALQWEAKPKRLYSGKTFKFNAGTAEVPDWYTIPVEVDQTFFEENPEKAKMMYLLMPPPVQGAFFEYTEKIDVIKDPNQLPFFKTETAYIPSVDTHQTKMYYIRKKIVGMNNVPNPNIDYVGWIDAAETTCDASLAIGHKELRAVEENGVIREQEIVVLDDTIVWEPNKKSRKIVDIGSITQCCIDMLKYINLKVVYWDQWNSGTGVFDLRNQKIQCDRHNLVGDDWDFYKTLIYTNSFVGPEHLMTDKGVAQLKHLARTRTGNVTTGSINHKKDIADTWCGIATLLLGKLIQIPLRTGRAPRNVTITGSPGVSTTAGKTPISLAGMSGLNSNPFGGDIANGGRQFITSKTNNHTDLFPGLGNLRGTNKNSQVKQPGTTVQRSNFPRGISM